MGSCKKNGLSNVGQENFKLYGIIKGLDHKANNVSHIQISEGVAVGKDFNPPQSDQTGSG